MKNIKQFLQSIILITGFSISVQAQGLSTMYNFTNVDSLQFSTDASKHLAVIKEGNDLVILETYGEKTTYGNHDVVAGGYQLKRYTKSGGKYIVSAEGNVAKQTFNSPHALDYNTFVKTSYGYVACGPDIFAVFGKDLNSIYVANIKERLFIAAAPLKDSPEVAFLSYSVNNMSVGIRIFNYETRSWVTNNYQEIDKGSSSVLISAMSNRLVQLPDGNLFYTLRIRPGAYDQIFGKIDLAKVRSGSSASDFTIWKKEYNVQLNSMDIDAKGMMHAIVRLEGKEPDTEKLRFVHVNAQAATSEAFHSSITGGITPTYDDVAAGGSYTTALPGGNVVAIGIGLQKFGYQQSLSIAVYTSEMKLIRQYRLPTPFETLDDLDRGYGANYNGLYPCQFSEIDMESHNITGHYFYHTGGIEYRQTNDIQTDPYKFFNYHFGHNAVWNVLPGDTKDEMLLVTAHAIVKVNLLKYTECELRAPSIDSEEYTEIDAVSSSVSGTTTSTPSSTIITIKNDLSEAQNSKYGHVKLVFDGGSMVTKTLSRNHTMEIDCSKVKGVYVGNEANTNKGKLLFSTSGNCGNTIKLSSVW
jgi:hypothetical protein